MVFSFGPRTRFKCSLLSNVNKFIYTYTSAAPHGLSLQSEVVARKYCCNCNSMAKTEPEKQVIVIGIDDSDFSTHALDWTLEHLLSPTLNQNFKLVLVYARPSVSASVGFVGPGAAEVLPIVEADLRRVAAKIIQNATDLCHRKSVNDVSVDVMEGDPRIVLCDAVEKHHASMLVVGSHGYGALKRAVLGSVSDYCAHHAHCTVMIVKKPKHKH